jgi:hypothetical protein
LVVVTFRVRPNRLRMAIVRLRPNRPARRPGRVPDVRVIRDLQRILPPNTVTKGMVIRGLTRLDDKLLCIIRRRTISLKSRPSCAGRRRKPCRPRIGVNVHVKGVRYRGTYKGERRPHNALNSPVLSCS